MMLQNNNEHDRVITEPVNLQSRHEEADTLVAFHAKQASEGNILIRSTDTDVLVILLGLARRSRVISSSTTVPEIIDDASLCRILLPF